MKNQNPPANKSTRGNASQFFVAGELCRRGWVAVVTMGNTPTTDILCSNAEGTRFVHVQVKTFVPGNKTVTVGRKAEIDNGSNFVWVLAGIPTAESRTGFEYYIIPSADVAKNVANLHQKWLRTPGKDGQPHQDSNVRAIHLPPYKDVPAWDVGVYRDNWSLFAELLGRP